MDRVTKNRLKMRAVPAVDYENVLEVESGHDFTTL